MMESFKLEKIYNTLLIDQVKERIEKVILTLAIVSFIVHLVIIYLVKFGVLDFGENSDLINNPIAAIYTPFSFILLYEVYLLIYYLPKSFTTYIGKQYEIITLIIIRRLFKDLSNLELKGDWFTIKYDLQFTYDLVTSIIIFGLIYFFYKKSKVPFSAGIEQESNSMALSKFIKIKKLIALILVPLFVILSIYSFTTWILSLTNPSDYAAYSFNSINNIFFEHFFNILIFADVLVLLFSFFITDDFHKVIRNSGFIISTILIRISFSTSGLANNVLIISAIVFGLLIVIIHNKFEKLIHEDERIQSN
ncbi:MAG: hypothetical protein NWQ47_04025 [Crocinitomicaceae bacterium]|nr:hypothetical protein [Crocinitomicaceae bacterium]